MRLVLLAFKLERQCVNAQSKVASILATHDFSHLFLEFLGWDRSQSIGSVSDNATESLCHAVAQKRGIPVFSKSVHRTTLANRRVLRSAFARLRRLHHESILIFYCEKPRKQVWQWATTATDGRKVLHREHPFFSDSPPPRLLERLHGLSFSFEDEERMTLTDVLQRVRTALAPDNEFHLFAKRPTYAARSDALAVAMRNGEPGAFQRFVEFHLPLARRSSRMLHHWFGMDEEDAAQIATIGLIRAAERFDPERGFQFSTYASMRIRNACQRYGVDTGQFIRVPHHAFWPCYKAAFVEQRLVASFGPVEASARLDRELRALGVTRRQYEDYRRFRSVSFASDLTRAQRRELELPDDGNGPCEVVLESERDDLIVRGIESLNDRQAMILRRRYGFGVPAETLEEVAGQLGITRERVRQIQAKAETKLAAYLLKNGVALKARAADEEAKVEEADE